MTGDFNSSSSDSIDYLIFDKYLDQDLDFLTLLISRNATAKIA